MMKDELVSFETAQLAKEKGFNWGVRAYWFLNLEGTVCYESNETSFVNWNLSEYPEGYLSSPTQSLLQRWLREEKDVHISLDFSSTGLSIKRSETYTVYIEYLSFKTWTYSDQSSKENELETYEKALEQGLIEALKTIKP